MGFQLSSFIASDPEMWFEEMRIVRLCPNLKGLQPDFSGVAVLLAAR